MLQAISCKFDDSMLKIMTMFFSVMEQSLFTLQAKGPRQQVRMHATTLSEVGFDYVTGEYDDCGKIFRKRN